MESVTGLDSDACGGTSIDWWTIKDTESSVHRFEFPGSSRLSKQSMRRCERCISGGRSKVRVRIVKVWSI